MRLLILGGNGQVGCETRRLATLQGLQVIAPSHDQLDITDPKAVAKTVAQFGPAVVINAAAYTSVDRAEQEPEAAFAVNRNGAANLATVCSEIDIPLIHLSTDYIFDGTKPNPYLEDDPPGPLGVYSLSKWEGEEAVRAGAKRHLILRVSWVFGAQGHNFVKTILKLAREKEELRVVNDQWGCPTPAGDIAETVLALAHHLASGEPAFGTFHYRGDGPVTWHAFATAIVEVARESRPLAVRCITPIATSNYPTPARRPANSVLDCGKILRTFGIAPKPWKVGLEKVLQELDS